MPSDHEFGDRLRAQIVLWRERRGLLQHELADRVGCSKDTISLWERGQREPNALNVARLAEALQVSADVLLGVQHTTDVPARRDQPVHYRNGRALAQALAARKASTFRECLPVGGRIDPEDDLVSAEQYAEDMRRLQEAARRLRVDLRS